MSRPWVCLSGEWVDFPPRTFVSLEAFLDHCWRIYGETPVLRWVRGSWCDRGGETILIDEDSYEPPEAGNPRY